MHAEPATRYAGSAMRRPILLTLALALPVSAEPPKPPAVTLIAAPKPPSASAYVDVSLRWREGKVSIDGVQRGAFPSPTVTKRFLGRFEARVSGRGKPLDAVRFDFPLLGDADAGVRGDLDAGMKAHLSTATRVRVPLPEGAEAVTIVDLHGGPPLSVPLAGASAAARAPAASSARPDGGAR